MFGRGRKQNALKPLDPLHRPRTRLSKKEPFVQRDLIVPAPARMDLPPDGPDDLGQARLDRHMDVFEIVRQWKFIPFDLTLHPVQTSQEAIALVLRQNARARERPGLGPAPFDIYPK